jgi:hypothetical protein
VVFEPARGPVESLVGNHDALRLRINIEIGRIRPLTTRMWTQLFREMEQAALDTDMRLYEQAMSNVAIPDRRGFDYIRLHTDRFVVTSVERGSIVIGGAVLLAVGWVCKKFIEPGWEKSESKKHWDDTVAGAIDKAVPILKEHIDHYVVHRLKRLNIRRVSLRPPPEYMGHRLADNSTQETELIYDKSKQITHKK